MKKLKPANVDRRGFLKTMAGAAALPFASRIASKGGDIPIAVQLYCVRRELAQDIPGTVAAIAEMGFEAVEFADYFGRSSREWRRILDDNGLKCCGTHIYLEDMLGDKLSETLEFNQTLGNPNLIVRWLGDERRSSEEAFDRTVAEINEVAARLKPHGMRVGYHNHDYIFRRFGGEMLWNILADKTGPDVILQLDTGNASRAGQDVIELLKRNPGRTVTAHIKPYSASDEKAYLGKDDLDWPAIIQLMQTSAGTEWYIVEYEKEGIPPLEALRENLRLFKQLLGRR